MFDRSPAGEAIYRAYPKAAERGFGGKVEFKGIDQAGFAFCVWCKHGDA